MWGGVGGVVYVWVSRTTGERVRDVREVRRIQKWRFDRSSGGVEAQIVGGKESKRLKY